MCVVWGVFFFQAEDGIRDLVRSRGLGDVYKRQVYLGTILTVDAKNSVAQAVSVNDAGHIVKIGTEPVSYTHLTLPTSDLV